MTGNVIADVLVSLLGGGTLLGIVKVLVDRRRDKIDAPTPAEAQKAAVQVEAKHAGVPDPVDLVATVSALQDQYRREMTEVRRALAQLQREHNVTIGYVWALREQVSRLGHEPLPWPGELADFHAPSSIQPIPKEKP